MIAEFKSKRIAVLCGGYSEEREVSLRSGKNVLEALLSLGYQARILDPAVESLVDGSYDLAFNALHGTFGEDGAVQSLLEHCHIPYTGSGPQASLLGMEKSLTKVIMHQEGLPTPPFQIVTRGTPHLPMTLAFPVIAKPVSSGSSVGTLYCETLPDYQRHIATLLAQYGTCMVEPYITGQEITISVLDLPSGAKALPILELIPKNKFYDYEAKYTPNMTEFVIPARLDAATTQRCQAMAVNLHQLLGCRGMSRTDMIVHPQLGPQILEINTTPGMTDLSDLPAQAQAEGISFPALVEIILESARRP